LSAVFFIVALVFVYRSFYGMRIDVDEAQQTIPPGKVTPKHELVEAI
jgi:hypothetical protein